MINKGRLIEFITGRGVMFKHIAKKTNLSKEGLRAKLHGKADFKSAELVQIREALHLTDAEFLELFEGAQSE